MDFEIIAVNHVGLFVRDRAGVERFFLEVLGLRRSRASPSHLVLNDSSALHLIPAAAIAPTAPGPTHVALQVDDTRRVLRRLLDAGWRAFQVGLDGAERDVTSLDTPLDFGVAALFARDPDGNLVEFVERGPAG